MCVCVCVCVGACVRARVMLTFDLPHPAVAAAELLANQGSGLQLSNWLVLSSFISAVTALGVVVVFPFYSCAVPMKITSL